MIAIRTEQLLHIFLPQLLESFLYSGLFKIIVWPWVVWLNFLDITPCTERLLRLLV